MTFISKTNSVRQAGKKSVVDRISPINFNEEDGIKICLYGRSATGKTTLSATFPKPALTVVCSGGNKPGELRSINTAEYKKTIKQVALEHPDELVELTNYLPTSEFKTVILDHVTGLQDLVLKTILGVEELPAQKKWGIATQQQYGQCTALCKELLRGMLGLSCNVVIIAQEREFNTDGDVSEFIMPTVGAALSPSLTGWLNSSVDYICQTFIRQKEEERSSEVKVGDKTKTVTRRVKVKGTEYCLRTSPDPVYTTKFRIPKGADLPDVIVDPTYSKLHNLIQSLA